MILNVDRDFKYNFNRRIDMQNFNNHPTWKLVVVNGNLVWQKVK